jgi:hypothetical protein
MSLTSNFNIINGSVKSKIASIESNFSSSLESSLCTAVSVPQLYYSSSSLDPTNFSTWKTEIQLLIESEYPVDGLFIKYSSYINYTCPKKPRFQPRLPLPCPNFSFNHPSNLSVFDDNIDVDQAIELAATIYSDLIEEWINKCKNTGTIIRKMFDLIFSCTSESSRQRLRTLYPNFVSSIEQTKDVLLLWKAIASTHSSFIQSGTTALDNLNALSGLDRAMLPIVESTADVICDGTLVHLHDLNSLLVTAERSDSDTEVFLLSLDSIGP